jgi:hypothetical protein
VHKIFLAGALAASLAGCAVLTAVENMTPAQQVTLAAAVVNGVCQLTVVGAADAGAINSIVHPGTTSNIGNAAAGTITKVSAIDAATCPTLNGALATLASGVATLPASN